MTARLRVSKKSLNNPGALGPSPASTSSTATWSTSPSPFPHRHGVNFEITAVNQAYLDQGELRVVQMGRGLAWLDTGTFASLVEASEFVRVLETRQRLKIGSPEDVAYEMGFITAQQLKDLAIPLLKSGYGEGLLARAERACSRRAASPRRRRRSPPPVRRAWSTNRVGRDDGETPRRRRARRRGHGAARAIQPEVPRSTE